jgi:acyl-CoA thioesterase FadM
MTTKTVFNLFERARTDILGGPKVLAESSSSSSIDDDIIKYYVGRITDYSYVNDLPKSTIQDLEKGPVDICVLTQCIQVGDSMCDFQQQISSSNLLIAKANVLVVSVNGKTGGSSPYPMKIRKLFDLTNSV